MWKNRKTNYTINSILLFSVFANTIIIAAAFIYSANLFWLLLITIPLLLIGILNVKQSGLFTRSVWHYRPASDKKTKAQEWLSPSIYPVKLHEDDLKVLIGNEQCSQTYTASIVNISSAKITYSKKFAEQIIDKKSENSTTLYDERLRTYSLGGEDIVLQISDRNMNGKFNSKLFRENAVRAEVKLVELMLPAAIKPLHKTDSYFNIEDSFYSNPLSKTLPGLSYSTFKNAEGIIHFLDSLRNLSGKKPTGIRLSISDKKEFREICHAIRKTQLIPDFIVVEGPFESSDSIHEEKNMQSIMPLYEALLFVSQTIRIYGLEKEIKIIASGEIRSCFDILKALALGANAVYSNASRYRLFDRKIFSFFKGYGQDAQGFHNNIMRATVQAMNVCGCRNASEITLPKLFRRMDVLHARIPKISNVLVVHLNEPRRLKPS